MTAARAGVFVWYRDPAGRAWRAVMTWRVGPANLRRPPVKRRPVLKTASERK